MAGGPAAGPAARATVRARPLAPILLQGSLHETLWGGRNLATICGKTLPEGVRVGESWETALDTVARNAPYAGLRLVDLVEELGKDLLGAQSIATFGHRFPLLAKFIDAQQQLSVQVHPSDAYAAEHAGGQLGKTETWYILHAEPGAEVVYGLSRDATREEVRAAIAQTRLEGLLHRFEVHPGDVIYVPAGTVHAICSGIVLYELQEYSDITYRLYDYGRLQPNGQPRALHVDAALDVMRYTRPRAERALPVPVARTSAATRRILCACHYFVLEELRLGAEGVEPLEALPTSCQILSVLGGSCSLTWETGGTDSRMTLALGDTVLLPAALGGCHLTGEAQLMRSYVPEPNDARLAAWRAAQPVSFEAEQPTPATGAATRIRPRP